MLAAIRIAEEVRREREEAIARHEAGLPPPPPKTPSVRRISAKRIRSHQW